MLVEPGFTYTVDNPALIDLLRNEYFNNPDKVRINATKQNLQRQLGTVDECNLAGLPQTFWNSHKTLFYELMDVTYPRDPNYIITATWMKCYCAGHYSGLHHDFGEAYGGEDFYINVIMIDQSPDLEGGVLVLAGDSEDFQLSPDRASIRDRLDLNPFKIPGEAIVWNPQTIHGVSQVKQGHRLIFACAKVRKHDQTKL
jgi:hypothetical protein